MNLAKKIYDEYLEFIDSEFRVEDMDEMDYKDELGVIDFMIKKFKITQLTGFSQKEEKQK